MPSSSVSPRRGHVKWSIAWRVALLVLLVVACVGMALDFPSRAGQARWWPWVTSAFLAVVFGSELIRGIRAVRQGERPAPTV